MGFAQHPFRGNSSGGTGETRSIIAPFLETRLRASGREAHPKGAQPLPAPVRLSPEGGFGVR